MKLHSSCIVCGKGPLKALDGYFERHGLVKCQNCSFVFMDRIPTKDDLDAYYEVYTYSGDRTPHPETIASYHRTLDEFEPYRKTNRILDVGCGRGWFLLEAKKRGWDVYGTEYSTTAVDLCEADGIKMQHGLLDPSKLEAEGFDIITTFEVIEHINDPNNLLRNVKMLLRKGGLFYCTTPNFNSLNRYILKADYDIIVYPEHLSYYTKCTLSKLMELNGFRTLAFRSTGFSFTRFRNSRSPEKERSRTGEDADSQLRRRIADKWYLEMAKGWVDNALTLTHLGSTLKGYFIKDQ